MFSIRSVLTNSALAILVLSCARENDISIKTGLLTDQTLTISGKERKYILFVPSNYDNAPIVMLFHGHSSTMDQLIGASGETSPYKIWLDIAQQENILLAIPNGLYVSENEKGWNDCRADAPTNSKANDVQFVSLLIDHLISTYRANPKRVYANGTSNGGHFCIRLANEMPEKLTAFAAVAAANAVNSKCTNSTVPVTALLMNGTADPLLPFEGGSMIGNRGQVYSVAATVNYWVDRNKTEPTPEISVFPDITTSDNSTVEKRIFKNGAGNSEVAFYRITGGGHTEPSKSVRYRTVLTNRLGNQNGDIEMADEIWSFFKDKTK